MGEYAYMHAVIEYLENVEAKTRTYLKSVGQKELGRRVDFVVRSGQRFNLSVGDCSF
jgi:hypothetical protein